MDTQSGEDFGGAGDVDVSLEDLSYNGGEIEDLGGAVSTMVKRLELSLACISEKVTNLSIFVMNLETLECELEAMVALEENGNNDGMMEITDMECVEKGLEFDLLCGVLDSEVKDLDVLLGTLHAEIADAEERVSSDSIWKENLTESEHCLDLSMEQFTEIKKQSAKFQRTLSSYKREGSVGNVEEDEIIGEDDHSLNASPVIKMQTFEQQIDILRMLEKSLASEMDLEKDVNDSRQIEERLKQRMVSLEQELVLIEEEATDLLERWFEAENARQILMGISKDLLGRLQISQINLKGLSRCEADLRAKLEASMEQLKGKNIPLEMIESSSAKAKSIPPDSEVVFLSEKVCSLEKQLKESECQLLNVKASADGYQKQYNIMCSEIRDMENLIVELKENLSNAKSRADAAESGCKLLTEANSELNKELSLLKDGGDTSENGELLKRKLRETEFKMQHAVASAEASQEKQSMLYSTIQDMELVIKDLKSKVSKAESRADSAEDTCIKLSESNAELNDELNFVRSRLETMKRSLHLMEETKGETAKDIGKLTKVFQNLITQIAIERERLNKELSSLASENRILAVKLKQTDKDPFQEVSATSVTGHEVDRSWKNLSSNDSEVKFVDPLPDAGAVRRIDAGVLNYKLLFISLLVLLVSAMAFQYFKDVDFDITLNEFVNREN